MLVAGGIIAAALVAYVLLQRDAPQLLPGPEPVAPMTAAETPPDNETTGVIEPSVRFPIPSPDDEVNGDSAEEVLPPDLNTSDAEAGGELAALPGYGTWGELVVVQDLVRRIVVTVDNLPGEQMPWARSPIRPAGGSFQTVEATPGIAIAEANYARYQPYVELAEAIPAARLVDAYVRLYPLFQAAYDELGYPDAYFNDRLVAVIDHLLAAPEPAAPVRLVQPKVRYHFEDPVLQKLSAGQKVMVRMGVENARRVKAKLRQLRSELTRQ